MRRSGSIDDGINRAVWDARIVFILCLISVAGILGFVAHWVVAGAESELAVTQFESTADRVLTEAQRLAEQKRWAAITMASLVSETLPDASAWPFVAITGFDRIAGNLLNTSSSLNLGFAPIVLPEQLKEWEDYIYDYYKNVRKPSLSDATMMSLFGKGVWALNLSALKSGEKRSHDNGLYTPYGSPYRILTPLAQVNEEHLRTALLVNLHADPHRGQLIDRIIECGAERTMTATSGDPSDAFICGGISNMQDYVADESRGASSSIYEPIYPANNPTTVRTRRRH